MPERKKVSSTKKTNEYVVEKITNHRIKGLLFRVKWKNYSSADNTWEPLVNVQGCEKFEIYFQTLSSPIQEKIVASLRKKKLPLPKNYTQSAGERRRKTSSPRDVSMRSKSPHRSKSPILSDSEDDIDLNELCSADKPEPETRKEKAAREKKEKELKAIDDEERAKTKRIKERLKVLRSGITGLPEEMESEDNEEVIESVSEMRERLLLTVSEMPTEVALLLLDAISLSFDIGEAVLKQETGKKRKRTTPQRRASIKKRKAGD